MGVYHAFKFRQRMSDEKKNWTGNIQLGAKTDLNVVLNQLCKAFNSCPFFKHSGMIMRVDYLAPGRGKYFIARAEVLRLGRKGCTMRMTMVNDEDKQIAAGIASYAY